MNLDYSGASDTLGQLHLLCTEVVLFGRFEPGIY